MDTRVDDENNGLIYECLCPNCFVCNHAFNLINNFTGWEPSYLHFTGEERQVQGGSIMHPKSHRWQTVVLTWGHKQSWFSSVQFNSVAQSYPTLCDPMNRSTPGLPVHHQLPEFTHTHIHRVSDTIQPSHPLSSPSPPAPDPSQHQSLFQWPKYWSSSFGIIPSKEIPGLISFRMDWLDLLAVQGSLRSLLQHHSSKASILQRSAFLTVQLSHPYMTTGKTMALTRRT